MRLAVPAKILALREPTRIAWDSMRVHKLRTFLTLLGIILSVSTLIMVISMIEGTNLYIQNTVANLDNYHVVNEASVQFGFDRDNLTKDAKTALDQLASVVPNTKGYIIALEGGTDSIGDADYNYGLSERRANSVIQYLATQHNIPAHKIYVVGLGKDKPVDSNKTRDGRAKNRRVDVRLMTNSTDATPSQPTASTAATPSGN